MYLTATSPENIQRLAKLADGAAYPAVRPEVVGATAIAVADDAVVDQFSGVVGPLFERAASCKQVEVALAHTRDLLLPKLVSGELRVPEAERIAEAVE